jgi:hypothetical protein
MKAIAITSDMYGRAQKKDKEMGALKGSITKGKGNVPAFIGEEISRMVYGGKENNTFNFDFILPGGRRGEVKTKVTTVEPRPDYECSVSACNTTQEADLYIFTRVNLERDVGWVLGHLKPKDYFKKAHMLKEGEFDPSNKWYCNADCWNVKISELELPESLKTKSLYDLMWD